jgi:hypothetical protein
VARIGGEPRPPLGLLPRSRERAMKRARFTSGVLGHLLEVALFTAIVVADAHGLVPLTQTLFLVPFVFVVLRLRKEAFATIGFSWPSQLVRSVAIGVAAGVLLELAATYVTTPMISAFFGVEPDNSGLKAIQGNLTMLVVFLGFNWTLAAFGEEICFRGFLLKRLTQIFGGQQAASWVALILSSVLFGWGHTEQGMSGWVQEGLSGFWLGALFLLFRRNLTIPVVAHGVSNTLAFILIYFGRYPGLSGP